MQKVNNKQVSPSSPLLSSPLLSYPILSYPISDLRRRCNGAVDGAGGPSGPLGAVRALGENTFKATLATDSLVRAR
eukprot:SAG11_NODE_1864_length_4154_cov_1.816769_1_plen_76_part_00